MANYRKIDATEIGVEPTLVSGNEQAGLVYFTSDDSPVVGAQCDTCSTIVWVDQRSDSILNETRPIDVPEAGDRYRIYWQQKTSRFLSSLPPCPVCGAKHFGRFVNNVLFPRFSNGSELTAGLRGGDLRKQSGVAVYLLDKVAT